jgi:adenosine deaminase
MIETLNPHRVAHPIAAVKAWLNDKNDRGMKLLQERRIFCEICPYSNRLTGALSTPEEFKAFFGALDDFCVEYTFGPDSPALQNSTLAWELEWLVANGALDADQLERAFASADRATFIKEDKK